jgi:hypothetical protein
MHAFDYIIQKIINNNKNIYDGVDISIFANVMNYWNMIKINNELSGDFFSVKDSLYRFIIASPEKSKFTYLNHELNNIFNTEECKGHLFDIFSKVQKCYHGFSRFAYIYKFKKTEIQINHDLYLNPIDVTKKNHITILQNGKRYFFTCGDIINIINTALSNAPQFFVEPLISKNPYNNIPFNKSTLYNIYFFIKKSNYIMPQLIQNYFLSNFNLHVFVKENESIIRDMAIHNFVFKSSHTLLNNSVFNMISKYDKKKVLSIHDDFPSDILVEIMRPYLYLYYINKYSFMKNKIESSYYELHYKLHQFIKFNPTFGRKYIKYNSFTKKRVVEFNDKHINYNSITKIDFNNSHIDPYQENEFAGDIGIFEDDDDDDDDDEPVSHYDSSNNLSVNFRSTILTAFNLEIDFNNISINDNTIEEEDEEDDSTLEEEEEEYDY